MRRKRRAWPIQKLGEASPREFAKRIVGGAEGLAAVMVLASSLSRFERVAFFERGVPHRNYERS